MYTRENVRNPMAKFTKGLEVGKNIVRVRRSGGQTI